MVKKYLYKNRRTGKKKATNVPLSADKMLDEEWELVYEVKDGQMKDNKIYKK